MLVIILFVKQTSPRTSKHYRKPTSQKLLQLAKSCFACMAQLQVFTLAALASELVKSTLGVYIFVQEGTLSSNYL